MNKSEFRKALLEHLYERGYRYIARDYNSCIFTSKAKPSKQEYTWIGGASMYGLYAFSDLFQDIQFENEEPFNIAKELGIIDWSKVPKDTKVLVSRDGKWWTKRYFKEYQENSEKPFIVYAEGATSWSAAYGGLVAEYEYCKLAESEEEQ